MNSEVTSATYQVEKTEASSGISGNLGTLDVALATLAYAGPLAGVSGYISVVIGMGNGLGAPDVFLFLMFVLLFFAAAYCAFTRHVTNPGGFYAYITAGLGNSVGLASALFTLASYICVGWGFYAFAGLVSQDFIKQLGGGEVPWWACALVYWAVVSVLAYFHVGVSAKVLGVLLVAEVAVVIIFDALVIMHGGKGGLTSVPFHLDSALSGNIGIALLFGVGFFNGFEATAIYREEVRDPMKTIPRATYLVVIFIGFFYALTAWAFICGMGITDAVKMSTDNPATAFMTVARQFGGRVLVDAIGPLLLTSVFAAHLSIQNVCARYVYSLSTDGIFPKALSVAHHQHRSPHRASIITSLVFLAGVTAFVLSGMTAVEIYAQYGGLAQLGIINAMALTSLAAFVYFAKNKSREASVFSTTVAPVIAFISLSCFSYLGITNLSTLTGATPLVNGLMLGGFIGIWVVGFFYALWLKRSRPEIYRKIGRKLD